MGASATLPALRRKVESIPAMGGAASTLPSPDSERSDPSSAHQLYCYQCRMAVDCEEAEGQDSLKCPRCDGFFVEKVERRELRMDSSELDESLRQIAMANENRLNAAEVLFNLAYFSATQGSPDLDGNGSGGADPSKAKEKPTAQGVLDSLPTVTLAESHLATEPECPICAEDFYAGLEVLEMPCGHHFHAECVKPWLQKQNSCPVCRFELEMAAAPSPPPGSQGVNPSLNSVLTQLQRAVIVSAAREAHVDRPRSLSSPNPLHDPMASSGPSAGPSTMRNPSLGRRHSDVVSSRSTMGGSSSSANSHVNSSNASSSSSSSSGSVRRQVHQEAQSRIQQLLPGKNRSGLGLGRASSSAMNRFRRSSGGSSSGEAGPSSS